MSPARRAGAPRLIEWTGERCVPWTPDVQVVYEHYHRYLWAAQVIEGRRVLDLGSGEGFGAAILADAASSVVGIDVDETTVEHSRLNYGGPNVSFELGTAVDLSKYADGSFGAVVAFEIIEHVREQERVLSEVERVLSDDGILVISTPDRNMYEQANEQANPFHERELRLHEFLALLGSRFSHVAGWGQRTISGSILTSLAGSEAQADEPAASEPPVHNFFIARSGEEWSFAGEPAALFCVALASKVPLPGVAGGSTLADCGLELVRLKERDATLAVHEKEEAELVLERERVKFVGSLRERDSRIREAISQRDRDIARRGEDIVKLRDDARALNQQIADLGTQLADERQLNRRVEESVTWQALQRARGRLFGAIGEDSLASRALRSALRLAGRLFVKRPESPGPAPEPSETVVSEWIALPEYDDPEVSLIIPLYAQPELTRACLNSIRHHTTHVSYEVVLIDDAADPETKRLLEGVQGAKILHNKKNIGYLRSMNRAGAVARGRWLVLFNNDTEVTQGWLLAMLECAESAEDVGVVTPKFLYPDGTLNEAGAIIWRDGTGVNYGRGDAPDLFQYEYRRATDYGSAAALMVSAELWKSTGGFDELYLPMYYEDVDLCFEARERGLQVLYEPTATVLHIEGGTAGNDASAGYKRHQEENRPKFVAKWSSRLEAEHLEPAPSNVRLAANRDRGQHVLIVDHRVPMWDHDAGSLRMFHLIKTLQALGARVTFIPDNLAPIQPYTRLLQRMGVEVIYGAVDVPAELATLGPRLSAAILSRPHTASRWMDLIREFAPSATVAYDTVDLHWLREARRVAARSAYPGEASASNGRPDIDALGPRALALRELELAMVRSADVTIAVSESERLQVQEDAPDARLLVIPTIHEVEPHVMPPEDRSGVLFVGGFEHPPNIDAAVRLVTEVMPVVWRELGDVRVTIVGSHPPREIQALASPLVDVAGWVDDLQPLLDRSRLMVAPLRYGAGLKGKITQAMSVGLPVVTTPVGAEGLEGSEDEQVVLVAERSRELANQVVRVYRDEELWRRLSRAGQRLVERQCSTEVLGERLRWLLETASARVGSGIEH